MKQKGVTELHAILNSAKVDREGEWKIVLEIPMTDGPTAAALSLHTQRVFKVTFQVEDQG
jgi:hypothetical protein